MLKISAQMLLVLPLALGIGLAIVLQTAINSQLREHLNSPLQAGLLSFSVGTLLLIVLVMLQPVAKPTWAQITGIPWFLWLGGCLGVYAISASIFTAPKLGFLTFSGVVIFGQLFLSVLVDHYGWLGAEKTPINWQRVGGAVLIFLGFLLTLKR